MAIYSPEPFLTSFDKELLRLLSELVLQQEQGWTANRSRDHVELSDSECRSLIELLEQFLESKRAQQAAYLVEEVFSGSDGDLSGAREIFLRGRVERGRTRAVASVQWNEFLMRLGAYPSTKSERRFWHRPSAEPMSLDHFLRMETRLVGAAGIHPRVRSLILGYVRLNFQSLSRVLSGEEAIKRGQILRKPKEVTQALRGDLSSPIGIKPISVQKIAAVMTIVMDMSVLYTTRDWSVTGFMSTIAGSLPPAILD